ncbi:hypothetical protein [Thiolapillus sp.]|uniref:hypothetical protein n=3 Tax=Thiolapillus sp. TaxID=2017437 RepID=UPI0025FC8DED|nr:hypothetical protein [Thiolapillus sp.]
MTRTAGARIGCQRPSRFWGLGCPKIYHEVEDTLVQNVDDSCMILGDCLDHHVVQFFVLRFFVRGRLARQYDQCTFLGDGRADLVFYGVVFFSTVQLVDDHGYQGVFQLGFDRFRCFDGSGCVPANGGADLYGGTQVVRFWHDQRDDQSQQGNSDGHL